MPSAEPTRTEHFEPPPPLANAKVRLQPLAPDDFEALYAVASDPLIWEQHPNPDRYRREVFTTFFAGALESRGAYRVHDAATGELIGSSRFYDHDPAARVVAIGYTFLARSCWATGHNRAMKTLMLDYAFKAVERVVFHVGAANYRSRRAMEKLGARLTGEKPVAYHGEPVRPNVVYEIRREDWVDAVLAADAGVGSILG